MIDPITCVKCGYNASPSVTFVPEYKPGAYSRTGSEWPSPGHPEQLKVTCSVCGHYTFKPCKDAEGVRRCAS